MADEVCKALEDKGIQCWYAPRDVPPSTPYEEAIIDAIAKSELMALIISADANKSAHVGREVQNACSLEPPVTVLPFRIEDVAHNKLFQYYIGSVQWLNAFTQPLADHMPKLVENVQRLLAQRRSGTPNEQEEVRRAKEEEERVRREEEERQERAAAEAQSRREQARRRSRELSLFRALNLDADGNLPRESADDVELVIAPSMQPPKPIIFVGVAAFLVILVIFIKNFVPTGSGTYDLGGGGANVQPTPAPASSLTNDLEMEFILVHAGGFTMGSENGKKDELPVHSVTISRDFYMGRYEVTQKQWQAVMDTNPSRFKDCNECPVENVSWDEAQEFIRRLNERKDGNQYRLPTEAEWEYACRAGTETAFSFGVTLTSAQANFDGRYPYGLTAKGLNREKTMPVGSFKPNAWGLSDMHGNVAELCEDMYHENYNIAPLDGSAWLSDGASRVIRGGNWRSTGLSLRSSARATDKSSKADGLIGIRLVVDVPKQPAK